MSDTSITPSIQVTIGRQTRLYHAFITTAPAALDAPSTLTLCAWTGKVGQSNIIALNARAAAISSTEQ